MAESVFVSEGDGFVATELARGPWDPGAAHGGAPAALLVRAFEGLGLPSELMLARVTYEFLRPLQLGALSVSASVTRAGRRVARVQGSVRAADGGASVQAQGLYVHRSDVDPLVPLASVPGPEASMPNDLRANPERPTFATEAMEIRFAEGKFWGARSGHGVVPAARSARRRRGAVCAAAAGGRGRLRQRHQRGRALGGPPVHQPRPDPVPRARAGRRMDLSAVSDARRAGWSRASRKRAVGRTRLRRACGAVAARAANERYLSRKALMRTS